MSSPENEYPIDEPKYPDHEPSHPDGASDDFQTVRRLPDELQAELARLAPSRVTVLLRGGNPALLVTVARALHERSGRALGPFVLFDCAGLPADAVERELFGGPVYAAGQGAVHAAETGTLYVATIDELPLLMQPRFLRFLDEDTLVRVVVSVQNDLLARVARGQFRRDLGERLMLVELTLPASGQSV